MHFAGIGSEPGYLANIMFYNRAPNDLEYGDPKGPYFNFQEGDDCYFKPNNSMHCKINLYADAGYSDFIGTGSIDSDEMVVNKPGDGYSYLGGWLTLNTNITRPAAGSDPKDVNLRSQSNVRIYFKPERTWPDVSTGRAPGTNVLDWSKHIITLWGSDGWNGTDYVATVRKTGFDLRVSLTCPEPEPTNPPTPVPTPCPTCQSVFVASPSCGRPIEYFSSGNCASLAFSAASQSCGNRN
jgi:hypothetical protein